MKNQNHTIFFNTSSGSASKTDNHQQKHEDPLLII